MDLIKKFFSVILGKVDDTSPGGKVNSTDIAKTLRTTVMVGVASALAYFLGNFDPQSFGNYSLILVPVLTAALEMLNKLLKDNK